MSKIALSISMVVDGSSLLDGTFKTQLDTLGMVTHVNFDGGVVEPQLELKSEPRRLVVPGRVNQPGPALPPENGHRHSRRKGRGTLGYSLPAPGERMMDWAMRVFQAHPTLEFSCPDLARAMRSAGYKPPQPAKLVGSLFSALGPMAKKGDIEHGAQGGWRLTGKGRKCPIPVPYQGNGKPLRARP